MFIRHDLGWWQKIDSLWYNQAPTWLEILQLKPSRYDKTNHDGIIRRWFGGKSNHLGIIRHQLGGN